MKRTLAAIFGLGALAAPAAQASTEDPQAALEQARAAGTIEALEDALYRHPALKAAIRLELARFECAMGQQWRCGADGKQAGRGYGG